jgi:carbon monoxide dehydrogenase subunit G
MAKVTRSIVINASPDKVFEYMAEPSNLPEVWPSLIETKDVQRSPEGLAVSWGWKYKMAGMHFEGKSEMIEHVAGEHTVSKTEGGIASTITWKYHPEEGGTRVIFDADYTVPVPLLGKLAEAFVVKQNEKEAETILENLKARMET